MMNFFLSIFIDRRFVDVWFPNSTSSKLRNIEHLFEEMDKDNDKIIMPNEVDSDLKWYFYLILKRKDPYSIVINNYRIKATKNYQEQVRLPGPGSRDPGPMALGTRIPGPRTRMTNLGYQNCQVRLPGPGSRVPGPGSHGPRCIKARLYLGMGPGYRDPGPRTR